ncbi:hypothetical protein D3C80_1534070 [compost metagenome]
MGRGRGIAQLGVVRGAHAADVDLDVAFLIGDRQARHRRLQILDLVDAHGPQILAGDRLGHPGVILQGLFAPLGRHHHVAEVGGFILRRGGRLCGLVLSQSRTG